LGLRTWGCQRPGQKPALGVESEKEQHEAAVKLEKSRHGISQEKFCDLLARVILKIKQNFNKMTCLLKGCSELVAQASRKYVNHFG
jgi:hypothetical protein